MDTFFIFTYWAHCPLLKGDKGERIKKENHSYRPKGAFSTNSGSEKKKTEDKRGRSPQARKKRA